MWRPSKQWGSNPANQTRRTRLFVREKAQIPPHSAFAIGYDGRYTYAARIDPDRATSEAQQYSKGSGPSAGSLPEVREPERADYRPLGILSDSVLPV